MSQRYLGGIITANPTLPTLSSASGVWTLEQDFQNSASITPQVIGRSVRLRSSATAYFNRTLGSSGSLRSWTWSAWVKRGALSSTQVLFGWVDLSGGNFQHVVQFNSDNTLDFYMYNSALGGYPSRKNTAQLFRDPSAWYHIVCTWDSNNATAEDRARVYVNGTRVTAWASNTTPALNLDSYINNSSYPLGLGVGRPSGSSYFDGYLTEVNFIDGQALTPSSFGAFDSNGIWQPLSYRGTYGTNGFYLNFSDNSAATAAAIGKDYSGNGNNWTPNNISVTAGVTYDSMLDVPTMWADGGNGRGNYCTLNPLNTAYPASVIGGNLSLNPVSVGVYNAAGGTIYASSGKWYWEITITGSGTGSFQLGATNQTNLPNIASGNVYSVYYAVDGSIGVSGTNTQTGLATYTWNDVVGVAYDATNNTVQFYKNGASVGAQVTGVGAACTPLLQNNYYATGVAHLNCGQRPFAYTPPTGFKALNTQNLPDATINNGAQYMAATLWSGTSASQVINNGSNTTAGTSFQPDLVWTKNRNGTNPNLLNDSVRGITAYLQSNSTAAEGTDATSFTSFNSNGFTLGANTGGGWNTSGNTYVGWQWKAGGTAVSNTAGSITSSVSASTTAGFSVVTYTGTGSNATVGHGLGVAPKMIIVKSRSVATDWPVYHVGLTSASYRMFLNATNGQGSDVVWNNTAPTSTVFSIGPTGYSVNNSGATYVAYCFAAVAGYSAFGSYTGNGSADGPFVYLGFRPRFLMLKDSTNSGTYWSIIDTSRATYNVTNNLLFPNVSDAESTNTLFNLDILSNGFKVRNNNNSHNTSGATYIFAAFAENPFNISRAR